MSLPPWLEPTNDRNPFQLKPGEDANSRVARWRMSDKEFAELSKRTNERARKFIKAGCPGVPDSMRELFFVPDTKA